MLDCGCPKKMPCTRWPATRRATARRLRACSSAASAREKFSKIKAFQGITSTRVALFFVLLCLNPPVQACFSSCLMQLFLCHAKLLCCAKVNEYREDIDMLSKQSLAMLISFFLLRIAAQCICFLH